MKTKGDVKGGGTEKTEKEKEIQRNIAIPTHPLQVSIQAPTCRLPERAVKRGAPCPLPSRVIKPGNQTLYVWLYILCGTASQRRLSPTCTRYIGILSLFPTRLLLAAGK